MIPASGGGGGRTGPSGAPSGRSPTSDGSLRTRTRTGATRMNARTANAIAVTRQSKAMASTVRTGMNTSCPAELLAPKIPLTSPRLRTNQRRRRPRTLATSPVPMPASRPNDSVSCQISVTTLDTSSATAVTTRLTTTTRLTRAAPSTSPTAARRARTARGPRRPNDTEAVDQPGSSVIDRRNARRCPDAGRHEDHGRRDRDDDPPVEDRERTVGA